VCRPALYGRQNGSRAFTSTTGGAGWAGAWRRGTAASSADRASSAGEVEGMGGMYGRQPRAAPDASIQGLPPTPTLPSRLPP